MRTLRRKLIPVLILLGSLTGCSLTPTSTTLRDQLRDRGVVPLSADNPYVAANMLLAREAANSPVMKGFIDLRGAPDAIEIRRPFFKPYRFYFFYLDNNEGYVLEELGSDWIIRGPEQIPADVLPILAGFKNLGGKAVLRDMAPTATAQRSAPAAEQPAGHENLSERLKRNARGGEAAELKPLPQRSAPKPAPRESVPAEPAVEFPEHKESSSGDVVHVVQYPGETLRMITNWYTGDTTNTERVARINGISNADQLQMGQQVRIPRYLLQTADPFPEDGVERYRRQQSR